MATAANTPESDQDTTSRHTPCAHSYGSLMIAFLTPSVVRGSILKKEVSPKANAPGETTFFFIKEVDYHPIETITIS